MIRAGLLLLLGAATVSAFMLVPPSRNLAFGRRIHATSTCGEVNGLPVKELFCTIAAGAFSPHTQYTYGPSGDDLTALRQAKQSHSFLQGGQTCEYCEANTSYAHPASNMVDGGKNWWQSPPLSRGTQYNEVNITIDLEQEFHVAFIIIQMANSPRPGTWVLERSVDYGVTYSPWQYFANSAAECARRFGTKSLHPIEEDTSVICTPEFSQIVPMENGEIVIRLLENRPGSKNFSHSPELQNFARATNVRLRLLHTKTLQGHLMDLNDNNDPTVTRRYYYAIKEITMGGRCVCNGHADTCDVLDSSRPRTYLCRCDHNTCGDNCDKCCPGFEQKKWQRAKEGQGFVCEPCNCHGHSSECVYEDELDEQRLSLDIHGNYVGGGRCLNCRHNTEGINCNKCVAGFYRPVGKHWNETDVCQKCQCDPSKHTDNCAEETGKCECLPQFVGENCDQCAAGYHNPPECNPCQCHVDGTADEYTCLAVDGKCNCKENYGGDFCDTCAPAFTNMTAGCVECGCDRSGANNDTCNSETGQCECKRNFGGPKCATCAKGYYNHPTCELCECDPSGTEGEVCDMKSGQCLCKAGFAGQRCDQCDENHYGYPNCKPCLCDDAGSKSATCDLKTGECPCFGNFTGRTCDKCAAGFYDYPNCLACNCEQSGSKGLTCDGEGQCYCKTNFIGKQCNKCKPNFYNFPICEECNCHPSGVTESFAGCDKVAPGELCTCKENVMGRICSQCKPTFWDLQPYHATGCIDCACNMTGTISLLNSCDQSSGQCLCKRYVGGQKCDHCADGFFNLQVNSHVGCEACDCDIGGSVGQVCNANTGQCRCRPRVEGLKCNEPIKNHYFPNLWHMKYEAEEAALPNREAVRYAFDAHQFPNFSDRGFVVFSPIQDEIDIVVHVPRASVYKLLLHYANPTPVPLEVGVSVTPMDVQGHTAAQNATVTLPIAQGPHTALMNEARNPFILSHGRYRLRFKSQKRLFLDYIVLLPVEYYDAALLKETAYQPCLAKQDEGLCIDLLYPPLETAARVDASQLDNFKAVGDDDEEVAMKEMNVDDLPSNIGQAVLVETDNRTRQFNVHLTVPEDGTYFAVMEYYNLEPYNAPLKVSVTQGENTAAEGTFVLNHCPYATFCRELLNANGRAALLGLSKSPPNTVVTFIVQADHKFGIASMNLIKQDEWNDHYLHQVEVCIRNDKSCTGLQYPSFPNAILTEAESGDNSNHSINGDKAPFTIDNAAEVELMSLDSVQSTVEIGGVVSAPGHYVFVVHYFNPDNTPLSVDVLVQNDRYADVEFKYCPTTSGCRAIIFDKQGQANKEFYIEDKYSLTFYYNNAQKGSIYLDSVTAIPYGVFREQFMKPTPVYTSTRFFDECATNHFENPAGNTSDFCKEKIFSLAVDFNNAALPCDCNPQGAIDFCCNDFGGQCKCKENVIGRTCDRCAPGFYNFPHCLKCKCGKNQQCDERTGQCSCARFVDGTNCDQCVSYGFGYDPLIGCQLCGCHPEGSSNGELRCDANNGQCLCKPNVGGRRCERCLPGFYGFPHCYPCQCSPDGTTDAICDPNTAECICKKNVQGRSCDTCVAGTFYLRSSDPDGCSSCFCFGVTDRCVSSDLSVGSITFDDQSWSSTDPNGQITGRRGVIEYTSDPENVPDNVYFVNTQVHNKDYSHSYGLHISYIAASFQGESSRQTVSPDIKLTANDSVLEYWATEQSQSPSERFSIKVALLPEYWLLPSGEVPTRAQLMSVLQKLQSISIKASYFEKPKKAILEQFELEVASPDRIDVPIKAGSVEKCQCPAPYTGLSCQQCSPGYYRVKSDSVTGSSCVPCNCHGHTGTCDPDTGLCLDCQHNTEGDHCEKCIEGHYGNATTGSPYACLVCACPYPNNNFATSCQVSETGILESCNCKPGFIGDRCEYCDVGFYGDPLSAGACEPCFCNNNNNLTEPDSCNPQTGDCAQCQNDTDGRQCEYCKPWFYGDAVGAKNCTECTCDQCGSFECDNEWGNCNCQPLVEGDNCDRCVPNAWNFKSCQGCRMCECAEASSNSQCDLETGQCACMPGADGQRCERCQHGYWNYGSHGCEKCDCEADLSMGTVCDIQTGHCHCQEGASGPRCDTCVPGYLRIPTLGCRQCDECVFALNAELDGLFITVDAVNNTLSNVSSVALTGARLHKINKKMNKFNEQMQILSDAKDPESNVSKTITNTDSVLNDAATVQIHTDRLHEQLKDAQDALKKSAARVNEIYRDAQDLIGVAGRVIDGVRQLSYNLESRSAINNHDEITEDAKRILEEIRARNLDERVAEVQTHLDKIAKLQTDIKKLAQRTTEQEKTIGDAKAELTKLSSIAADFAMELHGINSTTKAARKILDALPFFQLNALISGIEKDFENIGETVDQHTAHNEKMAQLLEDLRALNAAIKEGTPQLVDVTEGVKAMTEKRRRKRETSMAEAHRLLDELKKIEEKAQRFMGIYDAARLEAKNVVDATHIYEDLLNTLAIAREKSTAALTSAHKSGNGADGIANTAQKVNEQSQALLHNVDELKNEKLKEAKDQLAKLETRLKAMNLSIDTINEFNEGVEASLTNREQLQEAADNIDSVFTKLTEVNATNEELTPQINEVSDFVSKLVEDNNGYEQDLANSKSLLSQVENDIPETTASMDLLTNRSANTEKSIEECRKQIAMLKERIELTRNKINLLKLSAHFEPNSHIEVPLAQATNDISVYTDIRFFFRTQRESGVLLYLGNRERNGKAEFIAVEVADKQPKLTISLGTGPSSVVLPINVNDNKWREVNVHRAGNHAKFRVSKPLSDETDKESELYVIGDNTVLNLAEESQRILLGGFPASFNSPSAILDKSFTGDIDKLRINDHLVGLWNGKTAGSVIGASNRPLVPHETSEESAVSFNGDGYLVMGVGSSIQNFRNKTTIMLQFMTYSPDGLLFFVGKGNDQLAVELNRGRVRLSFDLGSGAGELHSVSDNYSDGQWHTVHVNRIERKARLEVDGAAVEGESPGAMFEMSISDSIYLGGLPSDVEARLAVKPFRGCLRNLKFGSEYVNLGQSKVAKGIQPSCPFVFVRTVSTVSKRARLDRDSLLVKDSFELSLRFRTTEPVAHLISITSADNENLLHAVFENGKVNVGVNGDDEQLVLSLASGNDGNWHYLTASRSGTDLKVTLDDSVKDKLVVSEALTAGTVQARLGQQDDRHFIGCLGDFVWNGQLINYATFTTNEVKLTECAMVPSNITSVPVPETAPEPTDEDVHVLPTVSDAPTTEIPTTTASVSTTVEPRPVGSCALRTTPIGPRDDSTGFQFGAVKGSRLEFDQTSSPLDRNLIFSVQLRATANNGYILFVANAKQTEFIALLLNDGHVNFMFGQVNHYLHLVSNATVMDHEWHTVRVEREGSAAVLFIDGIQEANDRAVGLEDVEVQPPLYIGGVDQDTMPIRSKFFPERKEALPIRDEFGGCLRDFKLHDKKFDNAAREIGVIPCSESTETGVYFGKNGGYVLAEEKFPFTDDFAVEFEVRPRTPDGILLSVGSFEYATVELVNGNAVFNIDMGKGAFSVSSKLSGANALCDGHWHYIKVTKKKNIITIRVDQRSQIAFFSAVKKTATEALFVGGTPANKQHRGIASQTSFVGCVRNLAYLPNAKNHGKVEYNVAEMKEVGDVNKGVCPLD